MSTTWTAAETIAAITGETITTLATEMYAAEIGTTYAAKDKIGTITATKISEGMWTISQDRYRTLVESIKRARWI